MKPSFGLILLSLFIFLSCGRKEAPGRDVATARSSETDTGAIDVETVAVVTMERPDYISGNAVLEPKKRVNIVARTSGPVVSLAVDEGTDVSAGQLLLRLDDKEAAVAVRQAELRRKDAEQTTSRTEELFNKKLTSQESYEESKYQLSLAKAQLDDAELQLGYTRITAPFAGHITDRFVEVGTMVNINQKVFTLEDLSTLRARVYIPEEQMGMIQAGSPAKILAKPYPGIRFDGVVMRKSAVVEAESGTNRITVEIKDRKGVLTSGMLAKVYILRPTVSPHLVIPSRGHQGWDEGEIFVSEHGKVRKRTLLFGLADSDYIDILSGAREGDRIIISSKTPLQDGQRVNIR